MRMIAPAADWSDEKLQAELRRQWAAGKSASQIGAMLKVSRNAVLGAAHRLGLPKRASGGRPRGDGTPSRGRSVVQQQAKTEERRPGAVDKLSVIARTARKAMVDPFKRPPVQLMPLQAFDEGYLDQKGRVSLAKLQSHHCRFPIDCADGVTRYCGDTKHGKSAYCQHHADRCRSRA